jgi:hypothetical protein
MRSRVSENESLKRVFREAYAARGTVETGEKWEARTMRRIRQIGPLKSAAGFWPAFGTMVWRLAPVSCALIVVLTYFSLNMTPEVDSDYLGTLAADMDKPNLVELFGVEG